MYRTWEKKDNKCAVVRCRFFFFSLLSGQGFVFKWVQTDVSDREKSSVLLTV